MSDERLEEIKNNIETQMIYERNIRKDYSANLKEKIALYNEVIELKGKLKEGGNNE